MRHSRESACVGNSLCHCFVTIFSRESACVNNFGYPQGYPQRAAVGFDVVLTSIGVVGQPNPGVSMRQSR
jgi:hypothetical protein